jgi:uncharacterized protein (DUF1501 family)
VIRFVAGDPGPRRLPSRREWLRLGGLAGLAGLVLPRPAAAIPRPPAGGPGFGRARSVIVVYANGGQGQHETWDPKPDAPAEVRGAFGAIRTAVPGVFLGEHLPGLARRADRYTIIRSMSHDDTDHGSATYLALTGRYHPQKSANPPPSPSDHPCLGAALRRARPSARLPYTAVHVNGPALIPELVGPGQDGGFLGQEFEPMLVGDPAAAPASLPDFAPPGDLPPVRVASRRSLLASLDTYLRALGRDPCLADFDGQARQAYALLDSPRARAAFDLESEPARVRDRYGRHRSGEACLLARRLAEAEVPLITVFWNHSARGQDQHPGDVDAYGWDAHNDLVEVYRDHLLPRYDRSVSALLDDLEGRGLMGQTLVLLMGEFGRAPRVAVESRFDGSRPGRKHWANVYSIAAAGAGVARGAVLGASDRLGGAPIAERFGPWDVCATILSALGVDPALEVTDPLGRPFALSTGRPIAGLYRG